MTLDEAKELCNILARGEVPRKYHYNGSSRILRVDGGWVHLGEAGIRAAVVEKSIDNYIMGTGRDEAFVRVLVGDNWYYLSTEDKE